MEWCELLGSSLPAMAGPLNKIYHSLIIKNKMTLLEQLTHDYKEALKARNDVKKSVLNFVLAQIKNKKIELQKDLEDIDINKLLDYYKHL